MTIAGHAFLHFLLRMAERWTDPTLPITKNVFITDKKKVQQKKDQAQVFNKSMRFSESTSPNWCRKDPVMGLYAASTIRGITASCVKEQVEGMRLHCPSWI